MCIVSSVALQLFSSHVALFHGVRVQVRVHSSSPFRCIPWRVRGVVGVACFSFVFLLDWLTAYFSLIRGELLFYIVFVCSLPKAPPFIICTPTLTSSPLALLVSCTTGYSCTVDGSMMQLASAAVLRCAVRLCDVFVRRCSFYSSLIMVPPRPHTLSGLLSSPSTSSVRLFRSCKFVAFYPRLYSPFSMSCFGFVL